MPFKRFNGLCRYYRTSLTFFLLPRSRGLNDWLLNLLLVHLSLRSVWYKFAIKMEKEEREDWREESFGVCGSLALLSFLPSLEALVTSFLRPGSFFVYSLFILRVWGLWFGVYTSTQEHIISLYSIFSHSITYTFMNKVDERSSWMHFGRLIYFGALLQLAQSKCDGFGCCSSFTPFERKRAIACLWSIGLKTTLSYTEGEKRW